MSNSEAAKLLITVDSQGVVKASGNLDIFANKGAIAEKQTKAVGNSALDMGKSFKTASGVANVALTSLGVSALSLTGIVVGATRAWLEFDTAMRKVNSIAGYSAKQFKDTRAQVLDLASSLGIDATDAAKGLYEVIQADIPKENSIAFLATAAKAAEANATDTSTAVTALKNVINAYGIDASKADEISDKLFATVLYGGASFNDLASSLSGATVTGSAVGIKFEEILGIITTLTAQGTKTAEAVTQIERSMTSFLNPSEEMRKAFQLLHVANGQQLLDQYGLVGSLQKLSAAYAGNQDGLIKALSSIPAYQAALGLTGEKAEDAAKGLEQVNGAIGATDKAFAAGAGSTQRAINMVSASVTGLVENMENSLGAISKFAEALQGISVMIKEINNVGLFGSGADTTNAMQQGGAFGANLKIQQIKELEKAQQSLIKSGADASKAGQGIGDYITASGANNARLATINKEIDQLNASLSNLSESDRSLGFLQYEINDVSKGLRETTDPMQIKEYNDRLNGLRADYASYTDQVNRLKQSEVEAADNQKKAATEARKKAEGDAKHAKELLELEEDRKKALGETNKDAERLSTNEIEKLHLKQQAIRESIALGTANGGIDQKTGDAAIANLEKQIALINERNSKKGGGKGVGGGVGSSLLDYETRFEDSLPKLTGGEDTDEERLKAEEDELRKSYDRRREMILAATKLTQDQKDALMLDSETQFTERMRRIEVERTKVMLDGVSAMFTNLQGLAEAFGKRGFAAAKAAAIANATIAGIESTVQAYKQGMSISYYAAPVFAAVAAAATGAKIAMIAKQEYSGSFAAGGIVPGTSYGGDNLVARVNSDEVILNKPQQRQLLNMANGLDGAGGGGIIIKITNYGGDKVSTKEGTEGDKKTLEIIMGQASKRIADDIKKGGTPISQSIEKVYNLKR